MRYTIRPTATGGFDIIDLKSDSVAAHLPTVGDAAIRLTQIIRPDLDEGIEHQVADTLLRLRDEVTANIEIEFSRRLESDQARVIKEVKL